MIIAIDPGPEKSAAVLYDPKAVGDQPVLSCGELRNEALCVRLNEWPPDSATLAIESIAYQNRKVGAETFETARWIGEFRRSWIWPEFGGRREDPVLVTRAQAAGFVCASMHHRDDAALRKALRERFPSLPKDFKGSHFFAALAVAVTVASKATKLERRTQVSLEWLEDGDHGKINPKI